LAKKFVIGRRERVYESPDFCDFLVLVVNVWLKKKKNPIRTYFEESEIRNTQDERRERERREERGERGERGERREERGERREERGERREEREER
jgi:hypothetical protein